MSTHNIPIRHINWAPDSAHWPDPWNGATCFYCTKWGGKVAAWPCAASKADRLAR